MPFTALTIAGLLLHWPPAHQTSYLSQCPNLATALPDPSPGHPVSTSHLWTRPHSSSPLTLTPDVLCLGHLLPSFCLQRQALGKGASGYWVLRGLRGRECAVVGSPQGTAPGVGPRWVLDPPGISCWWREHFSSGRLCSSLKMSW